MAYGSIVVTDVATKILSANPRRQSSLFANSSTENIVWIGPDSSVTIATGFPVGPLNQLLEDKSHVGFHMGDVYGVCAAGKTADIRYWERIKDT